VVGAALLHGSKLSSGSPFPERASPHSVAVGHPETGRCSGMTILRSGTGSVSDTSSVATPDQGIINMMRRNRSHAPKPNLGEIHGKTRDL